MTAPVIAILTDFGTKDPFVGIIKGVLASLAPGVPTIDLTHEIPPGDIRKASIHLWQAAPFFPAGAIFLAVVDPGVGTSRRTMALRAKPGPDQKDHWFVGPDNGLFTYFYRGEFQAWEITNPDYMLPVPSHTFHGRDIFAPAAAHIARAISEPDFGPSILDPIQLNPPRLDCDPAGVLTGEILYADTFGNLLTSLGRFDRLSTETLRFSPWIHGLQGFDIQNRRLQLKLMDGSLLPLVKTFGEIPPGGCAAVVGSTGLLEIAANRSSAADLLKLHDGDLIQLLF